MLDRSNFEALPEDIKYSLYIDSITNVDYLKGVISGLLTKIPDHHSNEVISNDVMATRVTHKETVASMPTPNEAINDSNPQLVQHPGRKHLSLPKDAEHEVLILGDSISNRINCNDVGESVIVRAYGGLKSTQLLEKINNTRAKEYKMVAIAIGINDILDYENYNQKTLLNNIEKIVYQVIHKFRPNNIAILNLTPLSAYYKDFNQNVTKYNTALKQMITKATDIQNTVKIEVLDTYNAIQKLDQGTHTDGIHPSLSGLTAIVKLYRSFLEENDIATNNNDITMRQKPKKAEPKSDAEKTLEQLRNFFNKK